jgi:hypothetical protein
LVGEDENLLATRALLLSDWETKICRTDAAKAALNSNKIDAVILGQLVESSSARNLIELAKQAGAKVLLIRYPGNRQKFDAETHVQDLEENPAWLIRWAKNTLGGKSYADGRGPNPTHNPADPTHGSLESGAS